MTRFSEKDNFLDTSALSNSKVVEFRSMHKGGRAGTGSELSGLIVLWVSGSGRPRVFQNFRLSYK